MKNQTILGVLLLGALAACSKDGEQDPSPQLVQSFDDIIAPADFAWSTLSPVSLQVQAIPNLAIDKLEVLEVKEGQRVLFRGLINIGEDATFQFDIPSRLETVTVEVGNLSKQVPVDAKTLQFSLIQEADDSDLPLEDR